MVKRPMWPSIEIKCCLLAIRLLMFIDIRIIIHMSAVMETFLWYSTFRGGGELYGVMLGVKELCIQHTFNSSGSS